MFKETNFRPGFVAKPKPQGGQPVPKAPTTLRTNQHNNDTNSSKGKKS